MQRCDPVYPGVKVSGKSRTCGSISKKANIASNSSVHQCSFGHSFQKASVIGSILYLKNMGSCVYDYWSNFLVVRVFSHDPVFSFRILIPQHAQTHSGLCASKMLSYPSRIL